jgi:tetratricopeptide (TPR) repeat protein
MFRFIKAFSAILVLFILFSLLVPRNLSKDLFLSTIQLGKHNDIIFYREGRTATSILVKDKVSGLKDLYINSVEEVPTSYAAQYCFKLMGMLGVLIHPNPDKALMICFGGGIAAGTTIQHPKVKSLEVVDIEPSIIKAAPYLSQENNDLLNNEKVKVIFEDGRNFLFMTRNKYPLIISDSTHPKSADSWVLYTREFYQAVKGALAEGGVFVQWLPFHNLTTQEFQIILKTFQSEFPHTSLWLTHAFDEMGRFMKFSLVVGTPEPLSLDYQNLKQELSITSVQKDLKYWNLHTASGIMENFLSGEDRIREWTANVPINTDNLPWSYYNTQYSAGEKHTMPDFSPIAENIWPYLSNTGSFEKSYALKSQLDYFFLRKKLFLQLKFKAALDMLPQDKKAIKEKENIEMSKQYLIKVSEYYPNEAKSLLWLARGLRTLLGISEGKSGEDEALLNMLKKSVQSDPSFSESHLELAEFLWKEGKKKEGVEYYKQVVKINPDSFTANMRLGNFLSEAGKTIEAVKYFRKAVKIQPQNPSPHNNLAAILIQQNKLEEAVLHFKEALKINPNNAEIHNNLGAALLKSGKHKEAEKHFKEALSINPENYMAITNLANILNQKNEPEKAATLLYKAIQVNPMDSQSRQLLALSLIKLKTYSQAIKILQEGLRISPDDVAQVNILAKLLLSVPDPKLQDWKQALTLAKHACEVTEENNPESLDILASAYATQGNFEQAAVTARKAYDLAVSQGLDQMAEDIKNRLDIFENYLRK